MKKILLLVFCLGGLMVTGWSQDINQLLKKGEELETGLNDQAAYQQFLKVLELQPNNHTALYKASILADRLGNRHSDKEHRNRYYRTAYQYASKALKLYPQSADAHFAMSVSLGRIALMSSGKELVESVKKIKFHADRAIAINPSDFRPYHVLGRWYFEISNLGSFKRGAVKLFYGAFPDASFELSAKAYEKSLSLNPAFILNYLELARTYEQLDQASRAIEMLKKLQQLPSKMEDDKRIKEEGKKLLQKLSA
jgi:tetratricopeptide (TPR) repeat protein